MKRTKRHTASETGKLLDWISVRGKLIDSGKQIKLWSGSLVPQLATQSVIQLVILFRPAVHASSSEFSL
ncbi:MAG TPA: hypothetical protein VGO68_04025 [Pyrinomonadaceae bacterium]|nr:hypothetical protein [Pyrinomonadaceae bacterium]